MLGIHIPYVRPIQFISVAQRYPSDVISSFLHRDALQTAVKPVFAGGGGGVRRGVWVPTRPRPAQWVQRTLPWPAQSRHVRTVCVLGTSIFRVSFCRAPAAPLSDLVGDPQLPSAITYVSARRAPKLRLLGTALTDINRQSFPCYHAEITKTSILCCH